MIAQITQRVYTDTMQAFAVKKIRIRASVGEKPGQTLATTTLRGTETKLYYYGARYLDPKTSRWISADPAMYDGSYIPSAPINDEAKKRNQNLPGMGGIFNVINMHVYAYTHNNPINLTDPDGRNPILDEEGNLLGITGENEWAGVPIVMNKNDYKPGISRSDALKKGTKLDEYGKGIKITNETWSIIEGNGGEKLTPYVENNSNETIFYKPETDIGYYMAEGAEPLGAGKDLYMRVDGVKTSTMESDKVYKIPNDSSVRIDEQGKPRCKNIYMVHPRFGNVKAPNGGWHRLRDAFRRDRYPQIRK